MPQFSKFVDTRIVIMIFLLLLLPVIFFEFMAAETVNKGIERVIVQSNLQIGGQMTLSLRDFIAKSLSELKALSMVDDVRNLNNLIAMDVLDFYRNRNDSFDFLALIDSDGAFVGATGNQQEVRQMIATDFDHDGLDSVSRRRGSVFVGQKSQQIYPIWPILDEADNLLGFVVGKFRLRILRELIDSKVIGTSEHLFLTSRNLELIYGTSEKLPAVIEQFKNQEKQKWGSWETAGKTGLLVTIMPVIGYDLAVVITRNSHETFNFVKTIKFDLMVSVLIGIILAFILGFYSAWRGREQENEKKVEINETSSSDSDINWSEMAKENQKRNGFYRQLVHVQRTEDLMHKVLVEAIEILELHRASIMVRNEETDELTLKNVVLKDPMTGEVLAIDFVQRIHLFSGDGVAGHVFRTGTPLLVTDVASDSRFKTYESDSGLNETIHTLFTIPIHGTRGIIGVMNFVNPKNAITLDSATCQWLITLGRELGEILISVAMKQAVSIDADTSLFEEKYFRRRLSLEQVECRQFNEPISLLLLHIDQYKTIIENHDSSIVELLYRELASIIRTHFTYQAVPSRRREEGEIIILLPGMRGEETIQKVESLLDKIRAFELHAGEQTIKITVSAGFVSSSSYLSLTAGLIRLLEITLKEAMDKGGNQLAIARASEEKKHV